MHIYPYPYRMEFLNESFQFGVSVVARVRSGTDCSVMVSLWKNFTFGIGNLEIVESPEVEEHQLLIGTGTCKTDMSGYEYLLETNSKGAAIKAASHKGMLHGFMSLLQLIFPVSLEEGKESFGIRGCKVFDKPRLEFRGVHLCLFPETELRFIRKVIRLCGFLKLSHVVLELWGSVKLDSMPELAWEGAYEKEDLRPIIEDAKAFGVEIVPMFNHLGHASQARCRYGKHAVLDQNPRKAMLFSADGWTWNVRNPETLQLLEDVRKELIELFGEGEYFHIGCDEACAFEEELTAEERNAVLAQHVNTLAEDLKRYNRRTIMWGDMLLERNAWNADYSAGGQEVNSLLAALDKGIVIADWQYRIKEGAIETSRHFARQGFQVLPSPWNDYGNVGASVNTAKNEHLFGMLQTTWSDLQEDIIVLPYAGTAMWEDAVLDKSEISLGTLRVKAHDMIRKLMPSFGVYEDAGWKRRDT